MKSFNIEDLKRIVDEFPKPPDQWALYCHVDDLEKIQADLREVFGDLASDVNVRPSKFHIKGTAHWINETEFFKIPDISDMITSPM